MQVVGAGFVNNGPNSTFCSIKSLDNTFVAYAYGPVGDYDALKKVPAVVVNSTHMLCKTRRLHNAAPATVKVTMDGGVTWAGSRSKSPSQPIFCSRTLMGYSRGRQPATFYIC